MKSLKYNKNSWHSKLYMSTYGTSDIWLPENICKYFWQLVIAIIFFIPSWPGHLYNRFIVKHNECASLTTTIHVSIAFVFGGPLMIYFDQYLHQGFKTFMITYLVGLVTGIFIALIIKGIAMIFSFIEYKGWFKKKYKQKKTNPLIEGFRAFKGKYCSKIEWE